MFHGAASAIPAAQGLYDPRPEHDACGVAFVATLTGIPSHDIVEKALTALRNLEHRGASGAEPDSGDGAGILTQIPDAFFARGRPLRAAAARRTTRWAPRSCPQEPILRAETVATIEAIADDEGLTVLGWRDLPVDPSLGGRTARSVMPYFPQIFVTASHAQVSGLALERMAFCLRKRAELQSDVYFPSLSCRTIAYKGMLTTGQLEPFYPDLSNPLYASAIGLVHSRFSTNTFPSWPLAHPYRLIAHNGEINTVMGNRNWMRAREAMLTVGHHPRRPDPVVPDLHPGGQRLGIVRRGARAAAPRRPSLPHAVLMMIPEAWENHADMDPARRAFYEFHATFMEPWDGPANVSFTDGTVIGAVLDRNGLRPGRFWVTDDGLVVLASEAGVLDIDPATVVRKGRLQPGRMFLVDTAAGRIREDDEIKAELAAEHPYDEWLRNGIIHLDDLPDREHVVYTRESVLRRQQTFGYTEEELADPAVARWPKRDSSRSARWAPTPRSPRSVTGRGCCSTTSRSCSRR